jgi:hypothetical protein
MLFLSVGWGRVMRLFLAVRILLWFQDSSIVGDWLDTSPPLTPLSCSQNKIMSLSDADIVGSANTLKKKSLTYKYLPSPSFVLKATL